MFDCQDNENGSALAPLYFVSFVTLAQFIMLNLFIMIIVEEFEAMERERQGMTDDHMNVFKTVWSVFDPSGTMYIKVTEVEHLIRSLPAPMGIPVDASKKTLYDRVRWWCCVVVLCCGVVLWWVWWCVVQRLLCRPSS